MNEQDEEDLKELFERFFGDEQAIKAAEDVQKAEQMLRAYPSPEPDAELIADIKSKIAARLAHKRAGILRKVGYRVTVAAAVIIILATVSVRLFKIGGGEPAAVAYASTIPKALWESDDISTDDADLAILTAEVKQIEGEVLTLELGENARNGERAVMELEIRLAEIEGDFWKE
jgi:iron uptake system EfeUOB component EfeO/EfeM